MNPLKGLKPYLVTRLPEHPYRMKQTIGFYWANSAAEAIERAQRRVQESKLPLAGSAVPGDIAGDWNAQEYEPVK